MKLISQHTKRIMEGCKERARDAGLRFSKDTLEYYVTNVDMLELTPKHMIPTLYDYWLQDIQVLHGKGEYEIYPSNPYETVINTRPVISFYNDTNPDWLNVMIFYHVIGHIDFFQNNKFFEKTWDYDFKQKALTEKRIIAKLRAKKGRVADYVIEFAKSIDNLVSYFYHLSEDVNMQNILSLPDKADFYFNYFLQSVKKIGLRDFLQEVESYNKWKETESNSKEDSFFAKVILKNPEFEELFKRYKKESANNHPDLMQFIMKESSFINKEENVWMRTIIEIIRDTSLYFSPMMRTKTMNEGWASYWHEKLFLSDDRIKGHEVAFARINAKVTSLSRVGLNPYAIGWRLFMHVEEMANKGKYAYEYQKLNGIEERKNYDTNTDVGNDFIFHIRENYCDLTFVNRFVDQEFVDKHKLMVVGQRINIQKGVKEYYVKSRKAQDYKQMMSESLYHPPHVTFEVKENNTLYINHEFEGKELYRDYIQNTLIGLEYLWGSQVKLETTELDYDEMKKQYAQMDRGKTPQEIKIKPVFNRVIYTAQNKKVTKQRYS
ncbi:MAG: SpoVR family protein [Ignavibacteria bacterium]|nr:SpoVR family protein [Ignavibacteria bacterium]